MTTLQVLVLTISVLLVSTKFLDCYSTLIRLELPEQEINPFARVAIVRLGKRAAIWGVFVIVVIIVAVMGGFVYMQAGRSPGGSEGGILELVLVWSYALLGLGISVIQVCVAYTNWTGRLNVITGLLAPAYLALGSKVCYLQDRVMRKRN
jgi:hypothetical protein